MKFGFVIVLFVVSVFVVIFNEMIMGVVLIDIMKDFGIIVGVG